MGPVVLMLLAIVLLQLAHPSLGAVLYPRAAGVDAWKGSRVKEGPRPPSFALVQSKMVNEAAQVLDQEPWIFLSNTPHEQEDQRYLSKPYRDSWPSKDFSGRAKRGVGMRRSVGQSGTVADAEYIVLGQGYDSNAQKVVAPCLRPAEMVDFSGKKTPNKVGWTKESANTPFISVKFTKDLSVRQALSDLGISGSVKVQFGAITAKGKASFSNKVASSDLSTTYSLIASYQVNSLAISKASLSNFDGNSAMSREPFLTPTGEAAFSSADKSAWRTKCGDSVLTEQRRGGLLVVMMKVIFASKFDKLMFEGEISASIANVLDVTAAVNYTKSFNQSKTIIQMDLAQWGGNPSAIASIFRPELLKCNADRIKDCGKVFTSVFNYIGGKDMDPKASSTALSKGSTALPTKIGQPVSDFQKGFYNKKPDGDYVLNEDSFATLGFGTTPYDQLNVVKVLGGNRINPAQTAPEIPFDVSLARQALENYIDETLKNQRTLQTLLDSGRAAAANASALNEVKTKLEMNGNRIAVPVSSCIDQYVYSPDGEANCLKDLKEFAEIYYDGKDLGPLIGARGIVQGIEDAVKMCPNLGTSYDDADVLRGADWEQRMPQEFPRPLSTEYKPMVTVFSNGAIITVPTFSTPFCLWGPVWTKYRSKLSRFEEMGLPITSQYKVESQLSSTEAYMVDLELRSEVIQGEIQASSGIFWQESSEIAVLLTGPCYVAYRAFLGVKYLGFPTSDQTDASPEKCQFTNGIIYFVGLQRTPVFLHSAIYDAYVQFGLDIGSLGKPLSTPKNDATEIIAEFDAGFLIMNKSSKVVEKFSGSYADYRLMGGDSAESFRIAGWLYRRFPKSGAIVGEYITNSVQRRMVIPGYYAALWDELASSTSADGWKSGKNSLGQPVDFRAIDGNTAVIVGRKGALVCAADDTEDARAVFTFTGAPFQYWIEEGGLDGPFGAPLEIVADQSNPSASFVRFYNERKYSLRLDYPNQILQACLLPYPTAALECVVVCTNVLAPSPVFLRGQRLEYFYRPLSLAQERGSFSKPGQVIIGLLDGAPTVMYQGAVEDKSQYSVFHASLDLPRGELDQPVLVKKKATGSRNYWKSHVELTSDRCKALASTDAQSIRIMFGSLPGNKMPGICGSIGNKVFRIAVAGQRKSEEILSTNAGDSRLLNDVAIATSKRWTSTWDVSDEPLLRAGEVSLRHIVNRRNQVEVAFVWNDSLEASSLATPQLKMFVLWNTDPTKTDRIGTVRNVFSLDDEDLVTGEIAD